MHTLFGALPGSGMPVRVTGSALDTHRYTELIPCGRTSQNCRTIIPLSVSLWNYLADPVFNGVGLVGFKNREYAFLLA